MITYKPVELKRKMFNKCFSKQNLFHLGRYTTETHNDRMSEIDPDRKKNKYKFYTINTIEFDPKNQLQRELKNWYRELGSEVQTKLIYQFIQTLQVYKNRVYYIELQSEIYSGSRLVNYNLEKTAERLHNPYKDGYQFITNRDIKDTNAPRGPHKQQERSDYHGDITADVDNSYDGLYPNSSSMLFDFIYKDVRVVFYKFFMSIILSTESSPEGRRMNQEITDLFISFLTKEYEKTPKKLEYNMSFIVTENNSLRLKTKTRGSDLQFDNPNFIDKFYNNNVVAFHNKILLDIENSGKGLYLIHGLPGSGKTSYIEYLTYLLAKNERQVVYLPADNINFFSDPGFSGFALESLKDTVIVIEDAEEILSSSRTRNKATSTLLQLTDGFLSKFINCVIIGTFNTNIDNIDEALKREGRLKDVIEIGELEDSKIEALKTEFGITHEGKTLAKLFNNRESNYKSQNKKIGF